MGVNTEYCDDINGTQEFQCQCNIGFDGKRCEFAMCPLNCDNSEICSTEMNVEWKCIFPYQLTGR